MKNSKTNLLLDIRIMVTSGEKDKSGNWEANTRQFWDTSEVLFVDNCVCTL